MSLYLLISEWGRPERSPAAPVRAPRLGRSGGWAHSEIWPPWRPGQNDGNGSLWGRLKLVFERDLLFGRPPHPVHLQFILEFATPGNPASPPRPAWFPPS